MTVYELCVRHLVPTHAVTVEKADFLVLFSPHVVHTLVGLDVSDLQVETGIKTVSQLSVDDQSGFTTQTYITSKPFQMF